MQGATTVSIALPDAASTRALGARLAAASTTGTIVLLSGTLGSGKTTLVDGFARELGALAATSPTFVIAHSYPNGRIPLWHLDLYRIEDQAQVAELDLAQYISDEAITICEWPERANSLWPEDALTIRLAVEGSGRRAVLSGGGPKSGALLSQLT